MIVCLYGDGPGVFVEPVVADLQRSAARRGAHIIALTVEAAVAAPGRWRAVERVYLLPFDAPRRPPSDLPTQAAPLVRALFPRAEIINSLATHELCWNELTTARRLLERGVPMPATVITHDPEEAVAFIRRHEHAIVKQPRSGGRHGHLIAFLDDDRTIVAETHGRRYILDFRPSAVAHALSNGTLVCPPPFVLQRLVANVGRGGVLSPAQTVRAYIVDGRIVFWTERYRERPRRPSDFLISTIFGAKHRLLPAVSEAASTTARRAAEVLSVRIGAVDLIRAGSEGPDVLDVVTDGQHMIIDRTFKQLPEFRSTFDFDDYIAEVLTAPSAPLLKRA